MKLIKTREIMIRDFDCRANLVCQLSGDREWAKDHSLIQHSFHFEPFLLILRISYWA